MSNEPNSEQAKVLKEEELEGVVGGGGADPFGEIPVVGIAQKLDVLAPSVNIEGGMGGIKDEFSINGR